jgi:hypothetical protein
MANQTVSDMHHITWCKNFVSGPLTGMQVKCTMHVDAERCCEVQAHLNEATPDEPHSDCLTGSQWWASGVGCEEVR